MPRLRVRGNRSILPVGAALFVVGAAMVAALWQAGSNAAASLGTAGRSVFPLRTEIDFDTGEGTPQRATVEGTGTILFGRYVLTVAHAVTLDHLEVTVRTVRGDMTLPVDGRPVGEKTWLIAGDLRVPLTPLARDARADLALFLLPRGTDLPSFPYPIGDSDTLELGDAVALLGSDPVAGVLLRPGSVAALKGSGLAATMSNTDQVFMMSLALTSGESGAPVVARRYGTYELVGLAQGTYIGPRQLAWAIRLKPALEALSPQEGLLEVRRFLRFCRRSQAARVAGPRSRPPEAGAPPA